MKILIPYMNPCRFTMHNVVFHNDGGFTLPLGGECAGKLFPRAESFVGAASASARVAKGHFQVDGSIISIARRAYFV